ncbi:MAG TPA: hypothetical protein VMF89_34385, partial [Polyangiales bacterium]|nr:hypothetical protein [Polyangiales bacterium]
MLARRATTRLGFWLALISACGAPGARERVQPASVSAARDDGWRTLDDFEQSAAWRAESSDDVSAQKRELAGRVGRGLAVDFDFRGHGGYASLKRSLPLTLPEHYELSFALKGEAPINDLQLKFADESGENVWWFRKND